MAARTSQQLSLRSLFAFFLTKEKFKMLFNGLCRFVLEETVSEVLSTPRGRHLWKVSMSPAHIYFIHRPGSPYRKKLCPRSWVRPRGYWRPNNIYMSLRYRPLSFILVVTRMDTAKYCETRKFMYIKYKPILVVLPKVYQVKLWCNQNNLWKLTISSRRFDLITRDHRPGLDLITRDQWLTTQLFSAKIGCLLSACTCLCVTKCLTIFWSIHSSNNCFIFLFLFVSVN